MPHHYHLKIQSAIFWITFLGIVLFAQQPASAQHRRRIYYGTSASSPICRSGSPRTRASSPKKA